MDVLFATGVPFWRELRQLVRLAVRDLSIDPEKTKVVTLKIYDCLYRPSLESVECMPNGVNLHIHLSSLVRTKFASRQIVSLPRRAFSFQKAQSFIYRFLLQWHDVSRWGIPNTDQDDEFLAIWNTSVCGRIRRLHLGIRVGTELDHWKNFAHLFSGSGRYTETCDLVFTNLWDRDDLDFDDFIAFLRSIRMGITHRRSRTR